MRAYLDMYLALFLTNAFGIVLYESIFVYSFKRKKRFILRLLLSLLGIGALATGVAFGLLAWMQAGRELTLEIVEWQRITANFVSLLFGTGLLFILFDEKPAQILFAAICGSVAHVIGRSLYEIIYTLTGLPSIFFAMFGGYSGLSFFFYYAIHLVVIGLAYFFFGKPFARTNKAFNRTMSKSILISFVVVAFVLVGMQGTNVYKSVFSGTDLPTVPLVFDGLMSVFSIFVLLVSRFMLYWMQSAQEKEAEENKYIAYREQTELLRKNMELINIKCHDMKHQLRALLEGQNLDESFVKEAQEAISIYDANISTGNEALDVILTEKSLSCTVNKINFNVMIEGEVLSFLTVAEINSFFGNAIDNAIEYLLTVPEDKRNLRLFSRRNGNLFMIRIENYCESDVAFDKEGMPLSTKVDNGYHGFGTRSIRTVVETHGGTLRIKKEEDIFSVSALFSLEESFPESA